MSSVLTACDVNPVSTHWYKALVGQGAHHKVHVPTRLIYIMMSELF